VLAADIVAAIDYKASPLRERIAALEEQTKKLNEAVAEPFEMSASSSIVDSIRLENEAAVQRDNRMAQSLFRLLDLARGDAELFVFELIQNAVDAGAERLSIAVCDSALVVQHDNARRDGRGLSDAEVRAMCGVCTSSKTQHWSSGGFMGIGFKTLFKVFRRVEVHTSNGLHFALDTAPPHRLAGSTLPVRVAPRALDDGFDTLFLLSQPLVDAALRPPTVLRDSAVLGVFSAILARRGVRYAKLYGEVIGSAEIECFSVDFDTAPLWPSFCALRELDPASSGTPPKMRIEAFVSRRRRARHECWSLLPTLIECPFAFELDAPWMLDVDRQGLRNDQGSRVERRHLAARAVAAGAAVRLAAGVCGATRSHRRRSRACAARVASRAGKGRTAVRTLPARRARRRFRGARLYRWPKSLAWLAADASTSIPQRHLLLPPMLADGQFNAPSVDLLEWLGFVRPLTDGELLKVWPVDTSAIEARRPARVGAHCGARSSVFRGRLNTKFRRRCACEVREVRQPRFALSKSVS
jgi:hypothetical protein